MKRAMRLLIVVAAIHAVGASLLAQQAVPEIAYESTPNFLKLPDDIYLGEAVGVADLQFRRTNQDYNLDWHPAPRRQYVVTLSGESEIELDGGRKIRLGPGHILLAEDTTGQGHISRAVGTEDRISLFITLAENAKPPR